MEATGILKDFFVYCKIMNIIKKGDNSYSRLSSYSEADAMIEHIHKNIFCYDASTLNKLKKCNCVCEIAEGRFGAVCTKYEINFSFISNIGVPIASSKKI